MKKLIADSIIGMLRLKNTTKKEFSNDKIRKTTLQKKVFQEVFEVTDFPSTNAREELPLLLRLPHRSIQVWFQNKRQKSRKNNEEKDNREMEYDQVNLLDTYDIPSLKLI